MPTGREHHERIGIKMAWNENFRTKVYFILKLEACVHTEIWKDAQEA
jgi:hypothetical protein